MKLSLLPLLASPCCRAELRFAVVRETPLEGVEIEDGMLACGACRREYPILDGIPRLAAGEKLEANAVRTRDDFAYEWLRYPGSMEEDERIFLEEVQLDPGWFKGKRVLDAGCGMGRYSVVALGLGAEVTALDLSEALIRLPRDSKLHVVQGDLLNPPLKEQLFDLVYSHGVLHHTSDTRSAFVQVAKLVKPGGYLSVWLYGKAGRFADFATNPLRPGRAWIAEHRRLAWWIVLLRHIFSDVVRVFTTRLPRSLTYVLCYPLTLLGAIPGLKYLTFSVHPDFKVRLIENFDWVAPPFQWHHTKEELSSWYRGEGYQVLKVLPHGLVPKPGILGRRGGK